MTAVTAVIQGCAGAMVLMQALDYCLVRQWRQLDRRTGDDSGSSSSTRFLLLWAHKAAKFGVLRWHSRDGALGGGRGGGADNKIRLMSFITMVRRCEHATGQEQASKRVPGRGDVCTVEQCPGQHSLHGSEIAQTRITVHVHVCCLNVGQLWLGCVQGVSLTGGRGQLSLFARASAAEYTLLESTPGMYCRFLDATRRRGVIPL